MLIWRVLFRRHFQDHFNLFMLKTITEFVGYIIVAEPTISFLRTIYLPHSDISCVIITPGEEIDSAHMLLAQTSPVDYEKLCHLDVMGLADTPEDEQVKPDI